MKRDGHGVHDRELAGYVAPIIRNTDERVLRRKVTTYDRETGETTGEVTMREVVGGLAKVTALGLEVVEGVRPKEVACDGCGKVFPVPKGQAVPATCTLCKTGGQTVCPCGCGKVPPKAAFSPSQLRRRGGPWICRSEMVRRFRTPEMAERASASALKARARMTPEQRSEAVRKGRAAMTPEQRRATAKRGKASMTSEQRSDATRKANASRTMEQRSEAARKRSEAMTPEQRSDAARKANAVMSTEQKREASRRRWATRRANAAKEADQ